jgi:hypothetical protein
MLDLILMIGSGLLAWWAYPTFLSRSEKWRTAPFAYYANRLTIAVVVMFVVGLWLQPKIVESAKDPSSKELDPASKPSVEHTKGSVAQDPPKADSPASADKQVTNPPEVAKPSTAQELPLPAGRQQDPIPAAQVPSLVVQPPIRTNPSQMTREEIERLEKEKQYSGDDPIVRERLGLPPKPQ